MKVLKCKTNKDNSRCFIIDQDGNYFTGDGWSKNIKEGMLFDFTNPTESSAKLHSLYKEEFTTKKFKQTFMCPLFIDVYGDEKVSMQEIYEWLRKAMILKINYSENGTGPNDSGVLTTLIWTEMEEITKSADEIKGTEIDTTLF